MSLAEYVIFLIAAIVLCIVGLFKMKESEKKWSWVNYFCIILFCFCIFQRIVSEYMPGTVLAEICHVLMLAGFPLLIVVGIIIMYLANRDRNK